MAPEGGFYGRNAVKERKRRKKRSAGVFAPALRGAKNFSPRGASFQNFCKVLKTEDFNGAGHPSWVSRAHPSLPSRKNSPLYRQI